MREKVERIVRAGYDAANDGDFNRLVELLHPDIEFNSLIAEVEGRTYRGHLGAREWWDTVATSMSGLQYTPETIEVRGTAAIVKLRASGRVEQV